MAEQAHGSCQTLDFVALQGKTIRTCLQQRILWWKLLKSLLGVAPRSSSSALWLSTYLKCLGVDVLFT